MWESNHSFWQGLNTILKFSSITMMLTCFATFISHNHKCKCRFQQCSIIYFQLPLISRNNYRYKVNWNTLLRNCEHKFYISKKTVCKAGKLSLQSHGITYESSDKTSSLSYCCQKLHVTALTTNMCCLDQDINSKLANKSSQTTSLDSVMTVILIYSCSCECNCDLGI